ncbi:MAG TPA: EVE domain-containing protein [Cyanothece sp. UBA12306]|nr:EVE domain-containing protein [Cyanothece sp. UBA12306]
MAYWLFQANPKYYRIVDAIQELEKMPWLVTRYAKNMAIGDGILVWIAGTNAGIYAIAEIIELPQIFSELPDSNYWIKSKNIRLEKPRVMIRFIRKLLGQPLRRHELKSDAILKNLLVIRAPNSTNFKVTNEQWERVYQLKG